MAAAGKTVDVSTIALPFRNEIKAYITTELKGRGPKLVGFLATDDPSAQQYAEWTRRACARDGIQYELRRVDQQQLEQALRHANDDPTVHGILIYYPCFGPSVPCFYGGTMDEFLRDSISIQKDVEGLGQFYRGRLYRNLRYVDDDETRLKKCVLPCTPLAIVKILEHLEFYDSNHRLNDVRITIINRSDIVGRPLAAMLANDGATVYSADIESLYVFRGGGGQIDVVTSEPITTAIHTACQTSHVIITGVPVKSYRLPLESVSPGTTVINVASFPNVDEHALVRIPNVTYVPMVGQVTVAMLERNLMRLFENFHLQPKTYWQ